ncbi:unnamed protein product [Angiostrongylus costaricensis]|uniref:Serine/threonine-protein phosphatase 4 regulatory subunit 4 n=1 Tax=Angiostrongylus costaricensis TaxID=334426 RepID=A0A158PLG2_ANGCS|nr:unnamed protein product [Angiostrongylus costaricensis]
MVEANLEERPASSGLDWDKLFKMAEDCDLDDEIRGPIETALVNLESKEVHKLSAIRNLGELLQNEGEEAIEKVLPAVQRALLEERSNLDLHCEAAIVFKGIIQNSKLCARFPLVAKAIHIHNINLYITALKIKYSLHLLTFTHQQTGNLKYLDFGAVLSLMIKHEVITGRIEHLSAAAWLETLVEVAERVSLESVKQYIVPIVQQQAEPAQRVQRRIIASKLLHKLADILPANEVRKELGPCAQMLCQDSNSNVRTSMAQRLPGITMALKNSTDTVSLLLPCFVQLYKDDDMTVKEACMNNIAQCIPHFTNDAKKNTVFPMIKKSVEHSVEKKDETLMVIAKNFGEWCYTLRDVLDQLDMCWVLNTYCKIGQVSLSKDENTTQQMILTMCRRMTAFNLPCMIQMFPKSFDRLLPFIEGFTNDSDDDVRLTLASFYHEILMMHPTKVELVQPFIELIRGGSPEVVAKLTFNMDKTLPILYKCALSSSGSRVMQLDRILVGCNQVLRGTGSWRSHAALLEHISVLKTCLSYTQLAETFIPMLQKEVLQARAIPCRLAAASTLLQFMREQPEKKKREETIEFLKKEVACHANCYRRMLYLDIVELVLNLFSRKFFIHYFLDKLLSLTSDRVSNIRLRTVRMLAVVKRHLILPDDEAVLLSLERSVREVLTTEKQTSTRQLLQAVSLTRTFSLVRPLDATLHRPPETRSSPWRTQRRAVAVVRPQPVVVLCQSASSFRSSSNIRRPSYGLSRVSSQSTLERKPGHMSLKVRNMEA